ncbi:MAG: 6-carboxytetrahydropterin synthase [Nitrososphaerota archaeon]|nr:6-carboxytetrahydropterin synthase [Nitrososphaerota archaeon]MDG6972617.1 6-carboxytetrahydropterin synthase [Nitrososphaerota archaeon]MDG6973793.1 6-carboxytetrahydropterin synthase [Nitrososphaerota archaeon]MDG6987270.1 6-carboxytetrahydropterin synthase [Nitrososphaerota archaeon]MDG7015726.1 6-carboxytetrahydropterin synthase [Nitrososphaerota archaeon]
MSEQILPRLASRLKDLDRGAYERSYGTGGVQRRTGTHQLVADLLRSLGVEFKENAKVPGARGLMADFYVNGIWVFVEPELDEKEARALSRRKNCVIIRRDSLRSDRFDHGIRVLGLSEEGRTQTIFLDDPSFNFDYAHILPRTEKCSVMHGHTSSVLVEVAGRPIEGMVVDFGTAKQLVREAVRGLDHKLFVSEKYVTSVDRESVSLKFDTVHGEFAIKAPKDTTVLLEEEATVENLAREVLGRIAPKMPRNVTSVGVYVYEGLNKGSHILAKVHQDGAQSGRKKR